MKFRWRQSAVCCLLLIFSLPSLADRDQREEWTLNLYIENDLFAETDQDYTSGIRFSWVSPDVNDYIENEELPDWVRSLNKRLTFFHKNHEGLKRNVIVSFGQQIYTPKDLTRTDLIEDDRPYAAWLFFGLGYQTRSAKPLDTLDTIELRLGMIGPAAFGQEAQDFIHDLRGFKKFQGWDNQLENELGFVAVWEHKRKWHYQNENSHFGVDFISHTGMAIGTVRTHLNAGGEVRVGWAIPDDFGTSAIRPGGENSTPDSAWDPRITVDRRWGLHFFASFDVRLVARDIFVDGNTFKDSHSVGRKDFVSDAAVGFSLIYGGGRISYAHIFRSREFNGQPRSHSYGSLAMSYTF